MSLPRHLSEVSAYVVRLTRRLAKANTQMIYESRKPRSAYSEKHPQEKSLGKATAHYEYIALREANPILTTKDTFLCPGCNTDQGNVEKEKKI